MYSVEQTTDYIRAIAKAVQMPEALPKGRKFANMQEYLSQFNDEQLTLFLKKLSVSKYVQSSYFSLDLLRNEDIVNTLLVGGVKEKEAVNKYYSPRRLLVTEN